MDHEFDHMAKRLWFMADRAARLVAGLPDGDRHRIEQCLRSLYGVSIHLTADEQDIRAAIERVRRV
jgi:hypothetical protein